MQFSMREWRRSYNHAHKLGNMLKNSKPDNLGNPARHALHPNTVLGIEAEIKTLLAKTSNYLDACGMTLAKTKWIYDARDPTTWMSHDSFKYDHLVTYK